MIKEKKNILFLTLSNIDSFEYGGIYKDLCKTISNFEDFNLYVVSPNEKRLKKDTQLLKYDNNYILKVKIGNLTKTSSKMEKGISTIMFEYQYLSAIKKYFKDIKFDMVVYSTPPITFNKVIKFIKSKSNVKSYLILKDIFPQNAVDLNMMRRSSLIYKYFRRKEQYLYEISDYIGCMSQANIDYIVQKNKINPEKVELFPNSIKFSNNIKKNIIYKNKIRNEYNIPIDSTVFVYGGNLGKPQGIDFLIDVAKSFSTVEDGYLLIVGDGTEYEKLKIAISGAKNVSLYRRLEKVEYDKLIKATDVGLIFLDKRFTIPNFPSRLLSYMENSMPILAATDVNTDIGNVIVDSGSGYWVETGELDKFIKYANKLSSDNNLIKNMGINSRKHLEKHYDIDKNIYKILEKVKD